MPTLAAFSVAGWVIESASLYLVAAAAGVSVSVGAAVAVALIASLLSAIPITPSGLGFAEAGIALALGWTGLDAAAAVAVPILSRLITYWSIVFLGLLAYLAEMSHPVKSRLHVPKEPERSF